MMSRSIALLLAVLLVTAGSSMASADETSRPAEPGPGQNAAAAVADVFYVPGKVIVCTASGVLYVAAMAITFGALYQEATDFVKGGCGGKWVLTGKDIKPVQSY